MNNGLLSQAEKFVNDWILPIEGMISEGKVSIIIPVYFPEHLQEVIDHLEKMGDFYEIILVDDSGKFDERVYEGLRKYSNIKVLYHSKNLGRSAARNSGAAVAVGDILMFMDQDMFLNPQFIVEARKYYAVNKSLVFLGLRDTISFDEIPVIEKWVSPRKESDWRICTVVNPSFVDLTVLNVGNEFHGCTPNETICIRKMTNELRNMGIGKDNTLGFWDLPSMVISHTMAISKKDFLNIGGFPEWIQGWGGEDIVLGFLCCSAHIPIFLSNCVSYQAQHHPYSGSEETKVIELKNNINYYREWAQSIDEFPHFSLEETKCRASVYYLW